MVHMKIENDYTLSIFHSFSHINIVMIAMIANMKKQHKRRILIYKGT